MEISGILIKQPVFHGAKTTKSTLKIPPHNPPTDAGAAHFDRSPGANGVRKP